MEQAIQFVQLLNTEEEFTSLSGLKVIDLQNDSDSGSEEGQMSTTKLSISNPRYSEMNSSIDSAFYMKFFRCIDQIPGQQKERYDLMKERFRKFFIRKQGLQSGQRWNKRLEADYSKSETFPLCFAVMIYGVDYLSNRQIRKLFGFDNKIFKGIKRINWSNVAIIFQSKVQLQAKIRPFLYDDVSVPFFESKQQQEEDEQVQVDMVTSFQKLPRSWYGLRPYEHRGQYIFWFVRHLTDSEPDFLSKIRQKTQFMQSYDASKKLWQKRQRNKQIFDSSKNSNSRVEVLSTSQKERSVNVASEPQKRQRSRQRMKSSRQIYSENFSQSNAFSELYSNQNLKSGNEQVQVNVTEDMSFIYAPIQSQNLQVQRDLKRRSNEVAQMFQSLTLCGQTQTLENFQKDKNQVLQLDDDMQIISNPYDPKGAQDRLYFDRNNKISDLTQLKPDQKFIYKDYVQRIIEAEQQTKAKRVIPFIYID